MGTERLVVDAMLGSLARKLRIFGFDAVYFREGSDSELLRMALGERRVLLTSDRALSERARARGAPCLLIEGSSDRERLEVLWSSASAGGVELSPGPSRCAVCGTVLEPLKRADVRGLVPERVAASHRAYFRCPGCNKLYWKGGHWTRLRKLSSIVARR